MTNEQKTAILAACQRIDKRAQLARVQAMIAAEKAPSYADRMAERQQHRATFQRVHKLWRDPVASVGADPRNDFRGITDMLAVQVTS